MVRENRKRDNNSKILWNLESRWINYNMMDPSKLKSKPREANMKDQPIYPKESSGTAAKIST